MLESQGLLLRTYPGSAYPLELGPSAPCCRLRKVGILDAASGARLGSVQTASEPRSWFRWLTPAPWSVFETEDLSLVFTLRRYWRWSRDWVVRDAEGRLVGAVAEAPPFLGVALSVSSGPGPCVRLLPDWRLEDSFGRCLARLQEGRGDATGLFVTPAGAELGFLSRRNGDTELTFAKGVTDSPFTRMLLLATALVRG